MYEWFYSEVDYPFFQIYSEFTYLLKTIGCTYPTAPRSVWRAIRYFLGPPRPFSRHFTDAQRSHLEECRRNIRSVREGRSSPSAFTPVQLLPGNAVLVVHPTLGELLGGFIAQQISVADRSVHFYHPDIAPATVADCAVMPHAGIAVAAAGQQDYPTSFYELGLANIDRQENWAQDQKLLTAFQFLIRKREILAALNQMNDLAQNYIDYSFGSQKYSEFFTQSYSQLVLDLEETDGLLKQAVADLKSGTAPPPSAATAATAAVDQLSGQLFFPPGPEFDQFMATAYPDDEYNRRHQHGYQHGASPLQLQLGTSLDAHRDHARRLVESLALHPAANAPLVTNAVALLSFLRTVLQNRTPCDPTQLIAAAEMMKPKNQENTPLYYELFSLIVSEFPRVLQTPLRH